VVGLLDRLLASGEAVRKFGEEALHVCPPPKLHFAGAFPDLHNIRVIGPPSAVPLIAPDVFFHTSTSLYTGESTGHQEFSDRKTLKH